MSLPDPGQDQGRGEPINVALVEHQRAIRDWTYASAMLDLTLWVERMVFDFKLEIPAPALSIQRPTRRVELGHYCSLRNGFGLKDEISISEHHLREDCANDKYWWVLDTVLHELLHCWQQYNGKPPSSGSHNYHNMEFRKKAVSLGLVVDERGCGQAAPPPTPFWDLLNKHGIAIPSLEALAVRPIVQGRSSLKLYQCPCGVKIRSGRCELRAVCMDCNGIFERRDSHLGGGRNA